MDAEQGPQEELTCLAALHSCNNATIFMHLQKLLLRANLEQCVLHACEV